MDRKLTLAVIVAGLFLMLVGAVPAFAHQPEANRGSTPDWRQPYDVPFPEVSRAIRGILPPGGVDYYSFTVGWPGRDITIWLLTPMTPACTGFQPVMRLWAGPELAAQWNGREWYGALTHAWYLEDGSTVFQANRWGFFQHGERSNSGPHARPRLAPGTYILAVSAPPDRGGSYTFAIGDLEIPGGGVDPETMRLWQTCPQSWR